MTQVLVALAERCEAAESPNYALEYDIHRAIGETVPTGFQMQYDGARVPNYTASIDAAVDLIPDGWYWRVGHSTLYRGWAHLNRKHPDFCDREDEHSAQASSPALALCAAALKARPHA